MNVEKLYFQFYLAQTIFSISFNISLTHVLLRNVLFNFYIFWNFPGISRCIIRSRVWYILAHVPWELEKTVYSAVVG